MRPEGRRPPPPPPPTTTAARWTRNGEFLVYLVPVGAISQERYAGYVALLQQHRELPISALTRPGGYAAELSPFKSFSWQSTGAIRFRFVSTAERVESCDGEDVHAWNRPIGVIGICHCPSSPSLQDAHAQFATAIRHFPGTLVQKCFAFEHQFDERTLEQVAALSDLVMFPVHHELDEGCSTVSLHLRVVLDTLAVTILMSLESTIRAAMRQQAQSHHALAFPSSSPALEFGDMASFLLDTNVEPSQSHHHHSAGTSSTLLLSPSGVSASMPTPSSQPQSLHAAISSMASTAVSSTASALAAPFTADASRSRKRQIARHRKLFGDYSVLLGCVPDALEHYTVALELLKDEERKSNGASGDVLWLAAALEGYVYCLSLECKGQFVVEIVEKASDALVLYARAGVSDLECQFVEKIGWYCVAVATQLEHVAATTKGSGKERVAEAVWVKRLLWDVLDRGLTIFPDLRLQRQIEFVIEASRMLESVGHDRRMALFLHEAAALLLSRNFNSGSSQRASSAAATPPMQSSMQRQKDLQAALLLERLTAVRLGITDDLAAPSDNNATTTVTTATTEWEVTTLHRSTKTRRGVAVDKSPMEVHRRGVWLVLRLHVLRQLLSIAKMLRDPLLVARYCVQLLRMLPWCDSIASPTPSASVVALVSASGRVSNSAGQRRPASARGGGIRAAAALSATAAPIDQVQRPFTSQPRASAALERQGLFAKTSVYYAPPASIETKAKRYFSLASAPGATMSSAAASLSSTIASTPRILATPRQQFSAAVSAISTKASPAFASFSQHHHSHSHSYQGHTSPHGFGSQTAGSSNASPGVPTALSSVTSDGTLSPVFSPGDGNGGGAGGNSSHDSGNDRVATASAKSHNSSSGGVSGAAARTNNHDRAVEAQPVWDIRSQPDVVRLERDVLRILESECAALRPSEQVKLPTFLCIDSLRVLPTREHPFVTKAEALAKYTDGSAASANAASATGSAAASDFFYSPFEEQQQQVTAANSHGSAATALASVFPVHEKLELELVVSNPFGVAIEVQQASAWVVYDSDGNSEAESSDSGSAAAVECYPCSLALDAYERCKRVVLGVQPLQPGAFRVRGCFLKVLHLKTSFALPAPVTLRVVGPLPLAALSLGEFGSLAHTAAAASAAAGANERRGHLRLCMFASESKQCELRIRNVSARTISRWRLAATVRRRQVVKQSVVVFSNLSVAAAPDQMPPPASASAWVTVVETDRIALRCTTLSHSSGSGNDSGIDDSMVIASGDVVTLQCELQLLKSASHQYASEHEPLEEDEEVVWSFVYADDDDTDDGDGTDAASPPAGTGTRVVYYRESSLALTLVSLPSLKLSAASLLPSTAECVSAASIMERCASSSPPVRCSAGLDNSHFLLVVEVANPTETAFRFRMRRRVTTHRDDDGDDDDSLLAISCDVEIGRKCSRRLAIELPRVHPHSPLVLLPASSDTSDASGAGLTLQRSARRRLADILNELVEMEWETYFGTKGALRFEHDIWRVSGGIGEDDPAAMLELLAPEFSFEIAAGGSGDQDPITTAMAATTNGSSSQLEDDDDDCGIPILAAAATTAVDSKVDSAEPPAAALVRSPFVFFQGTRLTGARRRLEVRVLEFVSLAFDIRWRAQRIADGDRDAVSQASIEICVAQEDHEGECNGECDDSGDSDATSVVDQSVVVVGMLQRDLEWPPGDAPASSSDDNDDNNDNDDTRECVVRHEIQLMFLSLGEFRVSVCGRVWDAVRSTRREVWSHQPLYICATE